MHTFGNKQQNRMTSLGNATKLSAQLWKYETKVNDKFWKRNKNKRQVLEICYKNE